MNEIDEQPVVIDPNGEVVILDESQEFDFDGEIDEMNDILDKIEKIKEMDVIRWDPDARQLVCKGQGHAPWTYKHHRLKVLNKAITKHTTKYGHEFKSEEK